MIIGIDLGTTNSLAAYYDGKKAHIIPNRLGEHLTPSVVSVDDDGTVYQEYTLVIYLSDTTEGQVHAAADELIQVFNQSSVLIQANPTRTEFYPAS